MMHGSRVVYKSSPEHRYALPSGCRVKTATAFCGYSRRRLLGGGCTASQSHGPVLVVEGGAERITDDGGG